MVDRSRRTFALISVACALAGASCVGRVADPGSRDEALHVFDLAGRSHVLALRPGERAIVLHFWATWCSACIPELAVLERAAATCGERGVRVVAIDVAEVGEVVARQVEQTALGLEVLLDPSGDLWRRSGARELPATWIRTAVDQATSNGPWTESQWSARLRGLGC